MSRRTFQQVIEAECFSYLSRCAIRGEQDAIDTIKRIERENGRKAPRVLSKEELERHPNDDLPF